MCQGSTQYFLKRGDKEITRSMYRYYLTHDPYCTKTAMQAFNEDEEFQQRGWQNQGYGTELVRFVHKHSKADRFFRFPVLRSQYRAQFPKGTSFGT